RLSGLAQTAADTSVVHSLSPTTWLSGVRPKPTQGMDALAGVTADQIAAQRIGQETLLPSLEVTAIFTLVLQNPCCSGKPTFARKAFSLGSPRSRASSG